MKRPIFTKLTGVAILLASLSTSTAQARTPTESDFLGSTLTTEQIANWIQNMQSPPKSIGVFSTHVHPPLDPSFGDVIESDMTKALQSMSSIRVIVCEECRTPQVQLKGDRLVVTKGAPELEILRNLGKKNEVEAFLTVDTYRTKLSMVSQVNLYDSGTGQIIAAEEFKIPAFDVSDSAVQMLIKFGPGLALGGKSTSSSAGGSSADTSTSPPLGGAVQFLEELGFGKGGLTIGGAGNSNGSMIFLQPTLGWRGRFGATALTSMTSAGFGIGKSGSQFGISAGFSYDLFLGSFTTVGFQGYAVVPTSSVTPGSGDETGLTAFFGVSIGLSIGR